MNKTNKKGFTLVELLVVIAILAILATVSVVGYTAFIERATVSNDENVAAQLNQFLTAMKADNRGEFYNQTVTEENVWKVVDTMLKENGTLTELKPQSLDYGYHYFFDITDQKFIVLKDSVSGVKVSGIKLLVHAEDSKKPGFFTYSVDGAVHDIFLIDTTGSDLATAIRGFYTFDGIEAEEGKTAWEVFQEAIGKAAQNGEPDYTNNLNSTIFVTKDGNKTTDDTTDKTNAVIHDGVNSIEGSDDVDFSDVDNMNIPGSVQVIDNDVLGQLGGATITTDKTPEEIKGMIFEENSTGSSATITIKSGSTTITITITTEGKNEIKNDGQDVAGDYFTNKVTDFKAALEEITNMVANGKSADDPEIIGYVAWENGSFTIKGTDFVGEKGKEDLPVVGNIAWSTNSALADVAGNTVTFKNGVTPSADNDVITLTGTCDGVSKVFNVKVVYYQSAVYKLNNTLVTSASHAQTLLYGKDGANTKDSYSLTFSATPNTTANGIELTTALKVENDNFAWSENTLTLKNADADISQTIKVYPEKYAYLAQDVKVNLYNTDSLVFLSKSENIKYLGDDNVIKLGDLFEVNGSHAIPSTAKVWLVNAYAESQFSNMDGLTKTTNADTTEISLNTTDWKETTIQLKGGSSNFGDSNQITLSIIIVDTATNTRISADINNDRYVKIIDGKNIRDFAEIDTTVSKSTVLLNNITATSAFTIKGNKSDKTNTTFYGNGFTIDFTSYNDAATGKEGLITLECDSYETGSLFNKETHYLNPILDSVNIVGNVYASKTFVYQDPEKSAYGAALVLAEDGATIQNCYLANTRTPVLVQGDVTIKDSTIFGGVFCNILVKEGILTLDGNLTTINQTYKNVTGAGIVCDLTSEENYVIVKDTCSLTQYNFVEQNAKLPTVSINLTISTTTAGMSVSMSSVVKKLMADSTYSSWKYELKDTVNGNIVNSYFNTGIIYLTATGDNSLTSIAVSLISKDNKSSGSVEVGYEMATYSETYLMGPDELNLQVSAHAYVYSPTAKDNNGNGTSYVSNLFVNAIDEEFMNKYLPENYVTTVNVVGNN